MAALKALAKAKGTYYKPSSPGGTITWTSPPPDGIIYVDTYSGNPLTSSSPSSDLITVDIHGNWGSAGWSGWLVVAGSISISGHVTMNGLIYAQNDVSLNGTGGGGITGAVISTNRKDSTASTIADLGTPVMPRSSRARGPPARAGRCAAGGDRANRRSAAGPARAPHPPRSVAIFARYGGDRQACRRAATAG